MIGGRWLEIEDVDSRAGTGSTSRGPIVVEADLIVTNLRLGACSNRLRGILIRSRTVQSTSNSYRMTAASP
jgi:hypothetical protein